MRLAFFLLLFTCLAMPAISAERELVDAAEARAIRYPTVDVKFHVKESLLKGALTKLGNTLMAPNVMIPSEDTTLESDNRWVVDGGKFRFEKNHPMWNVSRGTLSNMLDLVTSDGQVSKSLFSKDKTESFQPWGVIHSNTSNDVMKQAVLS